MKAKYTILIALSCFTIMSFAQKKSTYLLSPITIEYQILQPTNAQKTGSPKSVAPKKQADANQPSETIQVKHTEINIPNDAFDGIDTKDIIKERQKMTNDCYIAYLIKTNLFKQSADRHLLNTLCDDAHIQILSQNYDKKTLKRCGKYHNKELHIYEK